MSARAKWAGRIGAVVLGVYVLMLSLPLGVWSSEQRLGTDFNTLDGAWRLEMSERLLHGELSGRDFVFTYGPLYQLTHGLGAFVPSASLATVIRYQDALHGIAAALLLWLLLAATKAPLAWRVAAFALGVSFHAISLKPHLGLGALTICGAALFEDEKESPTPRGAIALWAMASPAVLLYAFDVGVLTLIALLGTAILHALSTLRVETPLARRARKKALVLGGSALAGFAGFALLLLVAPGWSHYLPDAFSMATGYGQKMSVALAARDLRNLVIAAAAGTAAAAGAVALTRMRLRTSREIPGALPALAGAAVFAALWVRYGFTRSDDGHVQVAMLPVVSLLVFVVPSCLRGAGVRHAVYAVLPALALGWAHSNRVPRSIVHHLAATTRAAVASHPLVTTLQVDHAPTRSGTTRIRALGAETVYAWPWQSAPGMVAGVRNPSWTLQSYAATTEELEDATVERLQTLRPPALLFLETPAIDGVQNLSRTPVIFRHLLEGYELEDATAMSSPVPLLPIAAGAAPRMIERVLPGVGGSFTPGTTTPFGARLPPDGGRASDLLLLRVRSARATLPGLDKSGRLIVSLKLSSGHVVNQLVPLPQDGRVHPVLVSALPLQDPILLSAFSPGRGLRSVERLVAIQVGWQPIDRFTVRPESIHVESLSVLERRPEVEMRDVSIGVARSPELLQWLAAKPDGG